MIQKRTLIVYTLLPNPFQLTTPQHRNRRSITQDVKPLLNNIIFQYTNPLPFETEAHSLRTIPLIREPLDSYLFYIRYKILVIGVLFLGLSKKTNGFFKSLFNEKYCPAIFL